MGFNVNSFCPCGNNTKYKKCCKIFHENIEKPKTALELMRSRYCAFALNLSEYIIKTTHKDNLDFTNDILNWKKDIENFSLNTEFKDLEILEFLEGEFESFVTFKATLFQGNQDISFVEKSRFLKENNMWLYVDGNFLKD